MATGSSCIALRAVARRKKPEPKAGADADSGAGGANSGAEGADSGAGGADSEAEGAEAEDCATLIAASEEVATGRTDEDVDTDSLGSPNWADESA